MNVVMVDDDEAFLRSAQILLSRHGHRVTTFVRAADACLYLERWNQADVLVLDYMLGDSTAKDVLKRVRSRLPAACEVILISGHTDLVEPLELEALGVSAFLPKPLDFEKLCALAESGGRAGAARDGS